MTGKPWFRFYNEVLNDPKVQKLDGDTFKHWVNLLCIACQHDGKLPDNEQLAFMLRINKNDVVSLLDRLLIADLIVVKKGGANAKYIAPKGWSKRQYKSDTSTDRVKRYRNGKRNVTETPPDTDTDTDIKVISNDITKRRGRKRLNGVNSGFPKPEWAGDILWQDFLANRKTKRLTNTATAYAKFMADIEKYTTPDWPPKRILEYVVAKGWGAIYQPKTDAGTARGNHHGADNAIGTTDQAARKVLYQIRNADNAERQPAQPPSIMPSRGCFRLSGPMSSALLPSDYDRKG